MSPLATLCHLLYPQFAVGWIGVYALGLHVSTGGGAVVVVGGRVVGVPGILFTRTMPVAFNAPPLPGSSDYDRIYARVMECLGSRENEESFVITHAKVNSTKTNVSGFPSYSLLFYATSYMEIENPSSAFPLTQGLPHEADKG